MIANPAKLSQLSRLILRPCRWDVTAERWSRTIPHDFPGNYPDMLKSMVEAGEAKLAEIRNEHGPVGILVWNIVGDCTESAEFVVVALAGCDGRDITAEVATHCERFAKAKGASSIRFHTMRPGLIIKAEALGYRVSEIILRKAL